jgi:hypothetical protein
VTNKASRIVRGIASGENPISSVHYSLNGGPDMLATGTNVWFTPTLTLLPGTNTFVAYAVDTQTNQSPVAKAVIFYATSNFFKVTIQDWPHKGSPASAKFSSPEMVNNATPVGKKLKVGKPYHITVSPGLNRRFLGWFDSTNSNANLLSSDTTLQFVFNPHATIVARLEDPFYYIKGLYTGLFAETNVSPRSSGYMSFTMAELTDPAANKIGSGKILLDGTKYPFGKQSFDLTGHSHFVLPASSAVGGRNDLTVDLYADLSASFTGSITGTVSTVNWTADVQLYRNMGKPATDESARFTMVLPPGSEGPNGYTYGAINRSVSAAVSAAGTLADGVAWTAQNGSRPDPNGRWPLFAQLYKSTGHFNPDGVLWGWLQFTGDQQGVTGNVYWFRPHGVTSGPGGGGTVIDYTAGITNSGAIIGSPYINVTPSLTWPGNGIVFLYDGKHKGVTNEVSLSGQALTVITNNPLVRATNHVGLKINTTTGFIGGMFNQPKSLPLQKSTIKGVLLQNQAEAVGFFYKTNAGLFLMQPE